jgi:drug/metabolite transporter (DMT)-like permease
MPLAATLLALVTILLWSFLAFLGVHVSALPPLLVVGIALCVSGLTGAVRLRQWRVPWRTFAVGVGGIFGYHFLFFSAFQYAPPVEANLINYLWPLLIVLLSPLALPGYTLRPHHLLGALVGLSGAALIITGGRFSLDMAHLQGYLLAAGAALTWALYSLLTKRLPPFPTAAVGGFCLASGLLSLGAFLVNQSGSGLGSLSLPEISRSEALALLLLGAGPMGAAFFTWDAALKGGDPRVIGALAYLTPLCSTLILAFGGGRTLSWSSGLAMLLITGGALLGSLELLRPPKTALPAARPDWR